MHCISSEQMICPCFCGLVIVNKLYFNIFFSQYIPLITQMHGCSVKALKLKLLDGKSARSYFKVLIVDSFHFQLYQFFQYLHDCMSTLR